MFRSRVLCYSTSTLQFPGMSCSQNDPLVVPFDSLAAAVNRPRPLPQVQQLQRRLGVLQTKPTGRPPVWRTLRGLLCNLLLVGYWFFRVRGCRLGVHDAPVCLSPQFASALDASPRKPHDSQVRCRLLGAPATSNFELRPGTRTQGLLLPGSMCTILLERPAQKAVGTRVKMSTWSLHDP